MTQHNVLAVHHDECGACLMADPAPALGPVDLEGAWQRMQAIVREAFVPSPPRYAIGRDGLALCPICRRKHRVPQCKGSA